MEGADCSSGLRTASLRAREPGLKRVRGGAAVGGAGSPPLDAVGPQSPRPQLLSPHPRPPQLVAATHVDKTTVRMDAFFFIYKFGVGGGGKTPLQIRFLCLSFQSPGTCRKPAGRTGRAGAPDLHAAGPDCCPPRREAGHRHVRGLREPDPRPLHPARVPRPGVARRLPQVRRVQPVPGRDVHVLRERREDLLQARLRQVRRRPPLPAGAAPAPAPAPR